MTKTTPQRVSPTPKQFAGVHKFSPAEVNPSILQRKNLKSRLKRHLKAKVREKLRARLFGGRRVHFDDVVRATSTKAGRKVRWLEVPLSEGKPVVIDEKHTDWLRGHRTRTLQTKNKGVEMWHATIRAAARTKAYYFV